MKYRKKPVVIDAIQLRENTIDAVIRFLGSDYYGMIEHGECVGIRTLEGVLHADFGDYIIRGVNGEHYSCKPDIFEKTYEAVE